jgi:hypothetical protein
VRVNTVTLGGVRAIDVRRTYTLRAQAILFDETERGFESLLFCMHFLELILCFCALDALHCHHLVRLAYHRYDSQWNEADVIRKGTHLLEQCLAQVLEFSFELFFFVRDLLRLAFLNQELPTQFLELAVGSWWGRDEGWLVAGNLAGALTASAWTARYPRSENGRSPNRSGL